MPFSENSSRRRTPVRQYGPSPFHIPDAILPPLVPVVPPVQPCPEKEPQKKSMLCCCVFCILFVVFFSSVSLLAVILAVQGDQTFLPPSYPVFPRSPVRLYNNNKMVTFEMHDIPASRPSRLLSGQSTSVEIARLAVLEMMPPFVSDYDVRMTSMEEYDGTYIVSIACRADNSSRIVRSIVRNQTFDAGLKRHTGFAVRTVPPPSAIKRISMLVSSD